MSESGSASTTQFTALLQRWQGGDADARDALMGMAYQRVRAIASQSLAPHAPGTLSPTDLAHEALLRLLGADAGWENRKHFFHVVAQATRQVIVDHARRHLSEKRGSGQVMLPLSQVNEGDAGGEDESVVRVDDALAALAQADERQARIVELSYFGGFSREEIADSMGLSVATIDRDLRFARAWLKEALAS